ncbi:MAG: hypothetical protein LBB63_03945 [Holosporaceae bacterium]|jgi:F0F1-type ATP synthase membrane subunit b/b'|nr:hypothetical protein [Holosporaceae bacterium]
MNFSPELSVVISFLGFSWIFMRKIYPNITKALDKHIESVENEIHEAELLREEATSALKEAHSHKREMESALEEARRASISKIERLEAEHQRQLRLLQEKYESQLKSRLETELARQKDLLLGKLSDLVMEKLSEKIDETGRRMSVDVDSKDLRRLTR